MSLVPYAYQPDGAIYVIADGPELLVFSGANDAPLWKHFCENLLVGVGATADRVFSLDNEGRLSFYRVIDGEKYDEVLIDGVVRGLDVSPAGVCAVVGSDRVVVVRPGNDSSTWPLPKAQLLAFGAGGGSLGVACADGTFHCVDPNTGASWGSIDLGGKIRSVAWCNTGKWFVATANELHVVSNDAKTLLGKVPVAGKDLGPVACSPDGWVVAVTVARQQILVYDIAKNMKIGTITYQRDIGALRFGPGAWLGVALADGDGNRVDLVNGSLTRTEPHPGRGQNRWGFTKDIEHDRVRAAIVTGRAGGSPVAQRIVHEWEKPKPNPWDEPEKKKGRSWLTIAITGIVLAVLCAGCFGLGGGSWFYYFQGLGPIRSFFGTF